jgi:hypothetical protein
MNEIQILLNSMKFQLKENGMQIGTQFTCNYLS